MQSIGVADEAYSKRAVSFVRRLHSEMPTYLFTLFLKRKEAQGSGVAIEAESLGCPIEHGERVKIFDEIVSPLLRFQAGVAVYDAILFAEVIFCMD